MFHDAGMPKDRPGKSPIALGCELAPISTHRIGRFLHGVFGEFYGSVIYDGLWVGRESGIPNTNGLRQSVIDGCLEAGVTAVRWPGGCCADYYHWADGIGPQRQNRLHPKPRPSRIWRHDFGTDEFIRFCRLINAEPILIANVATGTPSEFFDWFEYCNGDLSTKQGSRRAANGQVEPYDVRVWGIGNTDENVWHIDYNNPVAYAQHFLQWRTAIGELGADAKFIGLGLSERHEIPGWVEGFLDYVTFGQREKGPDSLSVHHYIGGAKGRYRNCGPAVDYTDEAYYYTLDALAAYQKDIDLHRTYIAEHTCPDHPTTISFDEWGLWHPEATGANGVRQPQTMRDAIFSACTFHLFYRNSDIVEYAMETQFCNLLQSLFETDGARFYRTPTFYVFKLFKEHLGQYLMPLTGLEKEPMLDALASVSGDLRKVTITLVNKGLDHAATVVLPENLRQGYRVRKADIIAPARVRDQNTFSAPEMIVSVPLALGDCEPIELPRHSIARITLEK